MRRQTARPERLTSSAPAPRHQPAAPARAASVNSEAGRLARLAAQTALPPGRGVVQRDPQEAVDRANRNPPPGLPLLGQAQVQALIANGAIDLHERRALAILWNRGNAINPVAVPGLVAPGVRAGAAPKPTERFLQGQIAANPAAAAAQHQMDPKLGLLGTDRDRAMPSRRQPHPPDTNLVAPAVVAAWGGLLPSYMTGYLYERNAPWTQAANLAFLDGLAESGAVVGLNHDTARTILQGTRNDQHGRAMATEVDNRQRRARRQHEAAPFGVFEELHHMIGTHGYTFDRAANRLLPLGHPELAHLDPNPNARAMAALGRIRPRGY